jgi:hypothetical protein
VVDAHAHRREQFHQVAAQATGAVHLAGGHHPGHQHQIPLRRRIEQGRIENRRHRRTAAGGGDSGHGLRLADRRGAQLQIREAVQQPRHFLNPEPTRLPGDLHVANAEAPQMFKLGLGLQGAARPKHHQQGLVAQAQDETFSRRVRFRRIPPPSHRG